MPEVDFAFYGSLEEVPETYNSGLFHYVESGEVFLDIAGKRIQINEQLALLIQLLNNSMDNTKNTLQNLQELVNTLNSNIDSVNSNMSKANLKISDLERRVTALEQTPEPTDNTFTFAFLGDPHYPKLNQSQLISALDSSNANILVGGGDFINMGGGLSNLVSGLNIFKNKKYKFLPIRGNHDDDSSATGEDKIPEATMKNTMFNDLPLGCIQPYPNESYGQYYYYDDVKSKIRIILLNSCDIAGTSKENDALHYFGISPTQISWLCNVALKSPNGEQDWKAVLISHTPIVEIGESNMKGWDTTQWNGGAGRWYLLDKVIPACNNKTILNENYIHADSGYNYSTINVDFTNNGMEIIAHLCGHVHWDNIHMRHKVPNISILNAGKDNWFGTKPSSKEYSFDLITIDRAAQKITLVRYGAADETSKIREIYWGSKASGEGLVQYGKQGTGDFAPEVGPNVPGTYHFNCIVFESNKLRYLSETRTDANSGRYLSLNCLLIDNLVINSGNGNLYFKQGILYSNNNYTTAFTGYKDVTAIDGTSKYRLYFSNGTYTGYSNTSSTTMKTPASTKENDFFGVAQNTLII